MRRRAARYLADVSLVRPAPNPRLHFVDWGAAQHDASITQRVLREIHDKGERYADDTEAATTAFKQAAEAARRMELADRRDDALQRTERVKHTRLGFEGTLGTHFTSLTHTQNARSLPAVVPSLNTSFSQRSRNRANVGGTGTQVLGQQRLAGPSHAGGVRLEEASARALGQHEYPSVAIYDAERASALADLDAFDKKIAQVGTEFSINQVRMPRMPRLACVFAASKESHAYAM